MAIDVYVSPFDWNRRAWSQFPFETTRDNTPPEYRTIINPLWLRHYVSYILYGGAGVTPDDTTQTVGAYEGLRKPTKAYKGLQRPTQADKYSNRNCTRDKEEEVYWMWQFLRQFSHLRIALLRWVHCYLGCCMKGLEMSFFIDKAWNLF